MSSKDNICYFCNKEYSNCTIISCCSHRICPLCLYERIFSNHIQDLQGQNELRIKCKCENGYLIKTLEQIVEIIKEKEKYELEQKENNSNKIIEGCECSSNENKRGKKFSIYFCLDCLKFVCKQCKSDIKNVHLKHRILKSKYLIQTIKYNIEKTKLKNSQTSDNFLDRIENLSKLFENLIKEKFNKIVLQLDDIIIAAKNLREFYINKFKKELGLYIETFKFIKIFYLNYYKDKENELKIKDERENNIYKLKLLNNISYEFVNMSINHAPFFEQEILKIKNCIDKLQNTELDDYKLIEGEFTFEKIKKGFRITEKNQVHQKFINALIFTKNNNYIVTSSNDYYMKIWDPNSLKNPKQEEKEKIVNLYGLKNGKILASSDNNILIYEFNNEKKKYEQSQSLTKHYKQITALSELDDGTLISGSLDKKIILWEEDPITKLYREKQYITTQKEVQIILALNDFKIAYSGNEDQTINILGTKTDLAQKIVSKEYYEICKLKEHEGKVSCMCKLNQDYFVSGGGSILKEKKEDYNIYIWKPDGNKFSKAQIIKKAHESDINSIILLRDGRFASASRDRTIKIWSISHENIDNKIEYVLSQNLNQFNHGLYKMIQLDDDKIVSTSSDNYLVIWRNTDAIF